MNSIELYNKVKGYISNNYSFLGINKKREIERLIFEILKIKGIDDFSIIPKYINYEQFKRALIKLRYPYSYSKYPLEKFFLGKLELSEDFAWRDEDVKKVDVFVEKDVDFENIFDRLKMKYTIRSLNIVNSIKECFKDIKGFNYNNRKNKIYITSERYDLLKPCPCTSNCVSCGYFVVNLGFGCPFDCEYCYLSGYQNVDGIIINTNIDDYIKRILNLNPKKRIRVGNGEFTDSLVYDDITFHSKRIINALKSYNNIIFEFKTKSSNILNILNERPTPNIVISYSVNPPTISKLFEHGCADYSTRLNSLVNLAKSGWNVGLHFDPMIHIEGWERMYGECISEIFSVIPVEKVLWISIGSLRFFPHIKKDIEKRFPDSVILNAEMIIDFDGKLRYPFEIRKRLYSFLINSIKKYRFPIERVYLCMEDKTMWDELRLLPAFKW